VGRAAFSSGHRSIRPALPLISSGQPSIRPVRMFVPSGRSRVSSIQDSILVVRDHFDHGAVVRRVADLMIERNERSRRLYTSRFLRYRVEFVRNHFGSIGTCCASTGTRVSSDDSSRPYISKRKRRPFAQDAISSGHRQRLAYEGRITSECVLRRPAGHRDVSRGTQS
jgi:hypothetical protein